MNLRTLAIVAIALALTTVTFGPAAVADHGSGTITVDANGGTDDGSSPFATIQAAVDHANSGDTVEVAAGTYAESIEIGKDLTLLGPNAGVSAVDGTRGAEAVITSPGQVSILLGDNADLTVDGFTFDTANKFVTTGKIDVVDAYGDVELSNNVFTNGESTYLRFRDNAGETFDFHDNLVENNEPSNGLRIRAIDRGHQPGKRINVSITDNVWQNNGAWAISANNIEGTIANNTVRDTGATDFSGAFGDQWGFLFAVKPATDLMIRDNTLTNTTLAGVWLAFGHAGETDIIGNTFTGTDRSDAFDIGGAVLFGGFGAAPDLSETSVHFNTFEGNDVAVNNTVAGQTVDATHNWWGSVAGPTVNENTTAVTGDPVTGSVTVTPWCVVSSCLANGPVHGTGADHLG